MPVGIRNTEANKRIILYPNPVKDLLYINDAYEIRQMEIYDVCGRQVKSINNPQTDMDMSNLNAGIYIVKLYMRSSEVIIQKIIKQ